MRGARRRLGTNADPPGGGELIAACAVAAYEAGLLGCAARALARRRG